MVSYNLAVKCKLMSELCIKQCFRSNNPRGKLTFISLTRASTHKYQTDPVGDFLPSI